MYEYNTDFSRYHHLNVLVLNIYFKGIFSDFVGHKFMVILRFFRALSQETKQVFPLYLNFNL